MSQTKSTQRPPKVFSYIRFSSPEQALGHSEQRQIEAAREYAKRKGIEFDEFLKDDGLSGFHGTHLRRGALGRFLDRVKAGDIPKGSILVIENIDRLGRMEVLESLEMVLTGLINRGITFTTLGPPEVEYNKESLKGFGIIKLILEIDRANKESERKSDLSTAYWTKKKKLAREAHHTVTNGLPKWLKAPGPARREKYQVIPMGEVVIVDGAKETIREMFKMKLKGIGTQAIARLLNEKPTGWKPTPSKRQREDKNGKFGWRKSYIKRILTNPATIGIYQPMKYVNGKAVPDGDPIENYYQAVVEKKDFYAVQEKLSWNRNKGGRTATNVLVHLVHCGYCGAKMHLMVNGTGSPYYRYLYCEARMRGLPCPSERQKTRNVRYDECEALILDNCPDLDPKRILPNASELSRRCAELEIGIAGLEQEEKTISRRMAVAAEHVYKKLDPKLVDRVNALFKKDEVRQNEIKTEIAELRRHLYAAEQTAKQFANWKADLVALKKHLVNGGPDARTMMNNHLRQLIERIDVFTIGTPQPKADEMKLQPIAEQMYDIMAEVGIVPTKKDHRFVSWMEERLMSTHGRYVVVKFKSGGEVRLAPPGSLASAMYWGPSRYTPLKKTNRKRAKGLLELQREPDWRISNDPIDWMKCKKEFQRYEHKQKAKKPKWGKRV